MAIREVLTYPHKILEKKAIPVNREENISSLLTDMLETLIHITGLGLAAPQVGVSKQIILYNDLTVKDGHNFVALINPEIIETEGIYISEEEGCLSVPGVRDTIKRFQKIRVKGLTQDMKPVDFIAEDFLAVILQHEIDHLNGILFLNHLSPLKRNMYRKQAEKKLKQK